MNRRAALTAILGSGVFLVGTGGAFAYISNTSCSSGQAKSSGCQGGNEVGGPASKDAACCVSAAKASTVGGQTKLEPGKPHGEFSGGRAGANSRRATP
jgi:hypothetical protein